MTGFITDNRYAGISGIDLSSGLYRFGVINSSGDIILPTVLGQSVDGVIVQHGGATVGKPAELQFSDCVPCVAGATVAIGDEIVTGTDGRGAPKTVTNQHVAGRAMSAAAAGKTFLLWLTARKRSAMIVSWFYNLAELGVDGTKINDWTPGFRGKIRRWEIICTKAATGAGATTSLTLTIDGVALTGGVLVPTLANMTLGAIVQSSAITAANEFLLTSVIDLVAATSTAFTAGQAIIQIYLD